MASKKKPVKSSGNKKSNSKSKSVAKKTFKKKHPKLYKVFQFLRALVVIIIIGWGIYNEFTYKTDTVIETSQNLDYGSTGLYFYDGSEVPPYEGEGILIVNDNQPFFSIDEMNSVHGDSYASYSELDFYGRAGVSTSVIEENDIVPSEGRGSLSKFSPSGWVGRTQGGIYDRSHLRAYTLGGEDRIENLVTGTEDLNRKYMTRLEDLTRDYVQDTGKQVLYRVTPLYKGIELIPRGILMEIYSEGGDLKRNVFIYNVQDGYEINYSDGSVTYKE